MSFRGKTYKKYILKSFQNPKTHHSIRIFNVINF